MVIDQNIIGQTFPKTQPYLVGREKIREFARATFADAAIHTDVAFAQQQGYADVVAPATFAIVIQDITLQQLLASDEFDVELRNLVHAEQSFAYTRPIVAGDELVADITVTGIRVLGANAMVTSETKITTVQHEPVVTATSVLFVGGGAA